jgi:hypothetical protein
MKPYTNTIAHTALYLHYDSYTNKNVSARYASQPHPTSIRASSESRVWLNYCTATVRVQLLSIELGVLLERRRDDRHSQLFRGVVAVPRMALVRIRHNAADRPDHHLLRMLGTVN